VLSPDVLVKWPTWRTILFYVEMKCQLDATEVFIAVFVACSSCFGHHYAHHQEVKSIIQWLLPVLFRVVIFKFAGLVSSILQTGHITFSSTPDQQTWKPQHEIPQAATTV